MPGRAEPSHARGIGLRRYDSAQGTRRPRIRTRRNRGKQLSNIAHNAALAVERLQGRVPGQWDYTHESLRAVDAVIDHLSPHREHMEKGMFDALVNIIGCYVLEVGRREHGGDYAYFEPGKHSVLVVRGPDFQVALSAFDVVENRLKGSPLHSTWMIYRAFSEQVRAAEPETSKTFGFFA